MATVLSVLRSSAVVVDEGDTVLKASAADGWRTLSRTRLPTFPTDCVRARSSNFELPYRFDVYARWTGYTVRIVRRDGTWTVRRTRH